MVAIQTARARRVWEAFCTQFVWSVCRLVDQLGSNKSKTWDACLKRRVGCLNWIIKHIGDFSFVYPKTFLTMDTSVTTTMKNAAKRDSNCELQNSVNHRNFERIAAKTCLRPCPFECRSLYPNIPCVCLEEWESTTRLFNFLKSFIFIFVIDCSWSLQKIAWIGVKWMWLFCKKQKPSTLDLKWGKTTPWI